MRLIAGCLIVAVMGGCTSGAPALGRQANEKALRPAMAHQTAQLAAPSPFPVKYDCTGSILHPLREGSLASSVQFWFGVESNNDILGRVSPVAPPLDLSGDDIRGRFWPRHDVKGRVIGGTLMVDWPHSANGEQVELSVMRETFIRVGPRMKGVAKVKMAVGDTMYVAGRIRFDPDSTPSLKGARRAAFISASCDPRARVIGRAERKPE